MACTAPTQLSMLRPLQRLRLSRPAAPESVINQGCTHIECQIFSKTLRSTKEYGYAGSQCKAQWKFRSAQPQDQEGWTGKGRRQREERRGSQSICCRQPTAVNADSSLPLGTRAVRRFSTQGGNKQSAMPYSLHAMHQGMPFAAAPVSQSCIAGSTASLLEPNKLCKDLAAWPVPHLPSKLYSVCTYVTPAASLVPRFEARQPPATVHSAFPFDAAASQPSPAQPGKSFLVSNCRSRLRS